jgi:hypothetical protein
LSRPFDENNNEVFSDADVETQARRKLSESEAFEIEKSETLTIGANYPVYVTHVNSPTEFFVHLTESKQKTANLMNNMDNFYRNGMHNDDADVKRYLFLNLLIFFYF